MNGITKIKTQIHLLRTKHFQTKTHTHTHGSFFVSSEIHFQQKTKQEVHSARIRIQCIAFRFAYV